VVSTQSTTRYRMEIFFFFFFFGVLKDFMIRRFAVAPKSEPQPGVLVVRVER
jgi:hypothetical protein